MKNALTLLAFLVGPILITAQKAPCSDADFKIAMSTGENAKNYQDAYKQFDLAEEVACTPRQKEQAKEKKQQLFNRIDRLRLDAKVAEEKALEEAKKATLAKNEADSLARVANGEKLKAEEALRLVKEMRDSADQSRQAELRLGAIVESNDLSRFGDSHLQKKNYPKAIDFYDKAKTVLDALPTGDSLLPIKIERLNVKIAEAKGLQEKFADYNRLVSAGDSLAPNRKTMPDAFQAYLGAWQLGLDSQEVIKKLTDLELAFAGDLYFSNYGKGIRYYEAIARSAETNLILGKPEIAQKRMENLIWGFRPDQVDFVTNAWLREQVNANRRKFIHRMEVEASSRHYFSSTLNFIHEGANVGAQIAYGKNSAIGFGIEMDLADDDQLTSATKLFQIGGSLYYAYNLFSLQSETWKQTRLRVQGLIGIAGGYLNLSYPFRRLASINVEDIPTLNGGTIGINPVQFQTEDLLVQYTYDQLNDFVRFDYQSPGKSYFTNLFAGISIRYMPFPQLQAIGFFATLNYHYQVQPVSDSKISAIKSTILEHFKQQYPLSSDEVLALGVGLEDAGINNNFKVKTHASEFNSGLQLRVGIFIRL